MAATNNKWAQYKINVKKAMRHIKRFSIFFILIPIAFTLSCSNTNDKLKEGFWKHAEGFYIGDIIDFKNKSIQIKNDTIFKNDTAIARIEKLESRWLAGDKVLHIKAIPSGKSARYVEK